MEIKITGTPYLGDENLLVKGGVCNVIFNLFAVFFASRLRNIKVPVVFVI